MQCYKQYKSQLFWSTTNETNRPSTILLSLQACSKVQFPNIYTILHIMAVWPLTSCESERSFSGLRRLKNYMRSRMKEDRLNGLALMMVHRTISVSAENYIISGVSREQEREKPKTLEKQDTPETLQTRNCR